MDALFFSITPPSRPEHDDDTRADERLTHVEHELTGLRSRLDNLLAYIRQDDMAPLTPAVRRLWIKPKEDEA